MAVMKLVAAMIFLGVNTAMNAGPMVCSFDSRHGMPLTLKLRSGINGQKKWLQVARVPYIHLIVSHRGRYGDGELTSH